MLDCNAVVIIPCKMDSQRLPRKNLSIIENKTLLEHSILYAQESKYTTHVVVSTESEEVKNISRNYSVVVLDRPKSLLKDADTVDVYVDAFRRYNFPDTITHVVGLQPDNPDRNYSLDTILEYFITKKYDDLVTVGSDGTRNGSVRVIKAEYVRDDNVSRRVGTFLDDCTNIHSEKDLNLAKERMKND